MAYRTQCTADYDSGGSIIRLKTWIVDGYSPWKTGWFRIQGGLYGTGYPDNIFWTTPGTSPNYIPTIYMADPYGNVGIRNMQFNEDDPEWAANYTIYTGATNKFCVHPALASSEEDPPRDIDGYWLAWPAIYSAGGKWWSCMVDTWS